MLRGNEAHLLSQLLMGAEIETVLLEVTSHGIHGAHGETDGRNRPNSDRSYKYKEMK